MKAKSHRDQQEFNQQGSSNIDEPEFICIGKIHRSHGINGAVIMDPMTDFPERIRSGRKVFVGTSRAPMVIKSARSMPPFFLVQFVEIDSPEKASELRNQFVFVNRIDLPKLPKGRYYFHQLIGLEVFEIDGTRIGKVKEILETGANDVYVIEKEDQTEVLAAGIPEVIREINLEEKKMVVNLPEWI